MLATGGIARTTSTRSRMIATVAITANGTMVIIVAATTSVVPVSTVRAETL
jgi:hypothetical protein